MKAILNIHSSGHELQLGAGEYKIDLLDGWGVKLGQFRVSFRHKISGQTIDCWRSRWPIRSHRFSQRATRTFIFTVIEGGLYKVQFENPETLRIRRSGLFFTGLLQGPIPNEDISIYIHL